MTAANSTRETFYTYAHYRADQPGRGPFYIGKGKRQRAWKTTGKGRSQHWQRIVAKHGLHVEIMATWHDEEDAYEHERQLIAAMRDIGIQIINLTDGGDGMRNPSQDVRSRLADAAKATWSDPERRAALLEARASDAARKKKSEALKRAFAAPGSKQRRSQSAKKAHATQENRAKLIAITQSPEYKAKMSAAVAAARARPEVKAKHDAANAAKIAATAARKAAQPQKPKMTKAEASRIAAELRIQRTIERRAKLPPEERMRLERQAEKRLRNKRLQREREARTYPDYQWSHHQVSPPSQSHDDSRPQMGTPHP